VTGGLPFAELATYYSPAMAAAPASPQRRRPRPGSLERPVNGRLYRGTWLLVALPLLLAAFTVQRPAALATTGTPPAFDRGAAAELARDLAANYPNRVPGTAGALGAARWFAEQLTPYGFHVETETFPASVPGLGTVPLRNLVVRVPGRSVREIVVTAPRDNSGAGPGAVHDASGTAALVELARAYAPQPTVAGTPTVPPNNYTIVFLSTDGGAFGNVGAAAFVEHSRYRNGIQAVINLDSIGADGRARLEFGGDTPRAAAPVLLATAAQTIQQETGAEPSRPSALRQLIDLGFPFSAYGQAPFVSHGIPAVTLTAAPDRPLDGFRDTPGRINRARLGQLGVAAQQTLAAVDQGGDLSPRTSSFVFLGSRVIRGWALELVLIASLLPFLAAVVDLFARCRRRRIPVAPALRSYRSRLGLWLWVGAVFLFFSLVGVWPGGVARPPSLYAGRAHDWPTAGVLGLVALALLGWFVARDRLLPRRHVSAAEEVAGYTGALLALSVVALLVVATNPYALVFLLPTLHVWLWLPQARVRGRWALAGVFAIGLAGPALLLGSFGFRYGLGWDAPWYVAELFVFGYAPFPAFLIGLCGVAGGAQLAALAAGRYAPYPSPAERRPRGPLRELVRRAVLAERARRRRASEETPDALEG
jgi:Peptidase family M28